MAIANRPKAVVTGGGSGIGRAFCVGLARRGGSVLIADIDEAGAQETARLVEDAGGRANVVRCDTSSREEVLALPAQATSRIGGVDVVVNNAGVAVGGAFDEIPLSDWDWLLGINLLGVVYGCHAFVPVFKKQGHGHVINVASAAGLLSAPRMAPYNVSKAGVVALSETLFAELRSDGVGVTVLCPTFVKTNIGRASRSRDDRARIMVERLMDRAKLTAEDVATAALEGADRGDLYVVPQGDGTWMWRLKRMSPTAFANGLGSRLERMAREPGVPSGGKDIGARLWRVVFGS